MLTKFNRLLTNNPSLLGIMAILLWATGASAMSFMQNVPPFEFLTLTFGTIFGFTLIKLMITQDWQSVNLPLKNWLIIMLGIPMQQVFYVFAYQNAAPEEVDLLIYLWPLMTLGFMYMLFNKKLTIRHVIAALMGFTAIGILSLKEGSGGLSFAWGHLAAIFCALVWSLYTACSENGPKLSLNIFGMSCGIGFFIALIMHLVTEHTHIPTLTECTGLLYYLVFIAALPIIIWTQAIQKGNQVFLTTVCYFKPVISIILLISLGFATFSTQLLIACLLVIAAGLLSNDYLMLQFGLIAEPKARMISVKPKLSMYENRQAKHSYQMASKLRV